VCLRNLPTKSCYGRALERKAKATENDAAPFVIKSTAPQRTGQLNSTDNRTEKPRQSRTPALRALSWPEEN